MFKKLAVAFAIVLVAGVLTIYGFFRVAKNQQISTLQAGSQIIETAAGSIEYRLQGEEGPVILYVSPAGYDSMAAAPEGFRILVPSRPGYLATSLDAGRTPAEQARAHAALLDALQIRSVIVMTISGGGPSAISFAAMYPERTRALIAISAASYPLSGGGLPAFLPSDFNFWALFNVIELFGEEAFVGMFVPDQANRQLILADPAKTADFVTGAWSLWPVSLRLAGSLNDQEQFREMELPIDDVVAPTLIVHGTADTSVPFEHSKQMATGIPGSVFHVIDGADHMMVASHGEEIAAVIQQFLAEQDLVE